jgi:hypothetical protein
MHYNIQINIQQVGYEEGDTARRGQTPTRTKRVVDVLTVKVVADSEPEAYRKARTMLEAATPKVVSKAIDPDLADEEEEDEDEF